MTTWMITVYEVRDIDGNLEIPSSDVEIALFSAGCRITDRITIDTGSMIVPTLEYNVASNEIQHLIPIQIQLNLDFLNINSEIINQIMKSN